MKKTTIITVISITVISCSSKNEKIALPEEKENFTSVKVANVTSEEVCDSLYVTGLLATENEARLSFKTSGVIDRIFVNEGSHVKKGQLLASLKTTEINTELDQANLTLEKAQRDYSRAISLYKDSAITREQVENSKTALDVAQKSVDRLVFNRQYALIRAEADGFVIGKPANEGEIAGPGTPVIIMDEAVANRDFLLRVGVTDIEWSSINSGQRAVVRLDAYPNKIFTGSVYRKSRSANMNGGLFQVDLRVNFKDETPAVGMFGKAILAPGSRIKEYTIPYEALIQVNGNKGFVYIPAGNNSLKKAEIVIKSFNERRVVVQSGIREGDRVIISNNAFLTENSKITITE